MSRFLSALLCATLLQLPAAAEPAAAEQEAQIEALAAEAQNPVSNLISVPFQYNLTPGNGPNENQTQSLLNIQPVVPFSLSPDLTLAISTPTSSSCQREGCLDLWFWPHAGITNRQR